MAKTYFNSRDELIAVDFEKVAVISANGNYTRIIYINKHEVMLSMGISKLADTLHHAKLENAHFIRLGRSCIINHAFMERIDVLKQFVVLTDGGQNEIRIKAPKQILKSYKAGIVGNVK